jgi:malate synthase
VLPDRELVTMTTPFMRAYTELLVKTCHRRGTHAIGGMAAFIPNRRRPEVTEAALARVSEDKRREATDGFDGTWVAHPDLVATALAEFDAVLGSSPNQISRQRPEVEVTAAELLSVRRPEGAVTRRGLETNIEVAIHYIASWLSGVGAAAIRDLMEDAATAEISRAQVWQWVHHRIPLTPGGAPATAQLVRELADTAVAELSAAGLPAALLASARDVFERVALDDGFPPFLTVPAYELIP